MAIDPNILHLRASNFYGGPERQIHRHALAGGSFGFHITVGSFTEKNADPEFLEIIGNDGIPVHTFQVAGAYDPRAVGRIKAYLRENNVRIICTHDYRTHLIGFLATRGVKTHWIAFSRGYTAENLKIKMYHLLDKIIIRFADRIVAVSHAQKKKLVKLLIDARKIEVVHNAIDCSDFENLEQDDLKARFSLPDESIVCVSAGRFSAEKGQAYLVRAAARAISRDERLYFILFGDGPDLDKMRNLAASLDCRDRILFPGFERTFLKCLKSADILVNPSLTEGLPNIVLEAMCLGTPVVATAVGGVPELIRDGYSGYLVPAGDTETLARRIVDMASDRILAAGLAANARSTLTEGFCFNDHNQKIFAIYSDVLS